MFARLAGIVLPFVAAVLAAVVAVTPVSASGLIGIYGIVTRVVFEPDAEAPERIQVWGAFAYVENTQGREIAVSDAKRGYLYFRLPDASPADRTQAGLVRREWADLKSVAGTGQAVGFGSWGYIGLFDALSPDTARGTPPYILERVPRGGTRTDLRVRPESETPAAPAAYQTNAGVVKLTAQGRHAEIIRDLRVVLERGR